MSKVKTSGDYVVPGFSEYAKQLQTEARSCFIAWKSLGKPRVGLCYTEICSNRGSDLKVFYSIVSAMNRVGKKPSFFHNKQKKSFFWL